MTLNIQFYTCTFLEVSNYRPISCNCFDRRSAPHSHLSCRRGFIGGLFNAFNNCCFQSTCIQHQGDLFYSFECFNRVFKKWLLHQKSQEEKKPGFQWNSCELYHCSSDMRLWMELRNLLNFWQIFRIPEQVWGDGFKRYNMFSIRLQ